MIRPSLTIGFTSHRIETLQSTRRLMEDHDTIIIEEAPSPQFIDMLEKKISITKYVREEDIEFPEFSKRYYKLLRELYQKDKKILQIEPYIEQLMQVYDMFSNGKAPEDVLRIPGIRTVYKAERDATAALINFYESSLKDPFQKVVESVKKFSRADAERFCLRDTMRAKAIGDALHDDKRVYIEAGGIHIYLVKTLRLILRNRYHIKSEFLLQPLIKKLTGKSKFLAPGDLLTLHYILGRESNVKYESLQAARSLIYIKLLKKEEMTPTRAVKAPHIEDEIKVISLVNKLTIEQCEEMYKKIRFLKREQALKTVLDYLSPHNNFILTSH